MDAPTEPGRPQEQPAAPSGSRQRDALSRRLRWLVPLAAVLLAFVVLAGVEALHQTSTLNGSMRVQSAGFYMPSRSTPVSFSLHVLQAGASTPSGAPSTVTMKSLRGKPVVLNMWSSSCTACRHEAPAVESVARRAGDAVRFVGVDTLDQRATGLAFLRRYHVSYLQLSDPAERVGGGYGIPGFPVTVFVSAKGKVVGEYLGGLSTTSLTHYLHNLFGVRVPPS